MTEVKQQPDEQENAQTPERVANTPEGEKVEVRGYDALHTKQVIGNIATNTCGAITKVNVGKKGPKPIPNTVNATTPDSNDAQKRAEERLEKIYQTLDPKLEADIDTLLTQQIQKYPQDMSAAIRSFLQNANFGFKFSDVNVGETNKYTETTDLNNTPLQVERHKIRTDFMAKLIAHGQQTVGNHIKKRLANYKHLLLKAQKDFGGGETQEAFAGDRYYNTLTAIAELDHNIENGEARYFYKKTFVDLGMYRP